MSRIVLVRHSIPFVDKNTPSTDWALTPNGELAASELAGKLLGFRPTRVLTSPEKKARQTAALIADRLALPIQVDSDLKEHGRSTVGFLPRCDFEAGIARLFHKPHHVVFGDESADAVFSRMKRALARARTAQPDCDLLLVTHGTAMSIYVSRALKVDPMAFWQSLLLPVAVVLEGNEAQIIKAHNSAA